MKEISIKFHDVNDELPSESGQYIAVTKHNFTMMPYSAKYKMFNVTDDDSEDDAKRYEITVRYWAYENDMKDIFNEVNEE